MKTWVNWAGCLAAPLLVANLAYAAVPVLDAESVDNRLDAQNYNMAPAPMQPPSDPRGVLPQQQQVVVSSAEPVQQQARPKELPSKSLDMAANANASMMLLNRIDDLEKEIQSLRGQLEVQTHKLAQVESQLQSGKTQTASNKTALKFPKYFQQPSHQAKSNAVSDEQSYMKAYDYIKRKEFPEAITALKAFVQGYPQSGYLANAYYWLGELYLAQGDLNQSLNAFDTVIKQFPMSNKAAGATLKKGFVYYEKGQLQDARRQLVEVKEKYPDTTLSRLAISKLGELDRRSHG